MLHVATFLTALIAGGIAAMSGFGIGSLLTPLLAVHYGTKLAVAMVSIPHLVGTTARFVGLRKKIDRSVFLNFGILSAAGGLAGALLNARAGSPALAIVFGCLLVFAAVSGLTGFVDRMRFGRKTPWGAGALSGIFGGLVGNQGGIRSAALLGFDIRKEALIATATAIALLVDGARMPVYLAIESRGIFTAWPILVSATAGALLGTFWGVHLLRRIEERTFRKLLYTLILALGAYMLIHGAMTQRVIDLSGRIHCDSSSWKRLIATERNRLAL
jgi:uncharacterized membrane protein YfcA